MISSIVHPTDFSPECVPAFEHALRLALLYQSELTLIHVSHSRHGESWDSFPQVRETMARWRLIDPEAQRQEVLSRTGVAVSKYQIDDANVVGGLARFLERKFADLLVMASHGRAGIEALFGASVTAELANATQLTTLIFGPAARSFVDTDTGRHEALRKVLVAVDHSPPADLALPRLYALAEGLDVSFDCVHVGNKAPVILGRDDRPRHVRTLRGPVVETLLEEARQADLIAMPMVGRKGLFDALRGSTTERIVREATRPVLALPV